VSQGVSTRNGRSFRTDAWHVVDMQLPWAWTTHCDQPTLWLALEYEEDFFRNLQFLKSFCCFFGVFFRLEL